MSAEPGPGMQVGLENQELAQIRINLMKQAGVQDLLLRGKAPRVSTLGRLSRSGAHPHALCIRATRHMHEAGRASQQGCRPKQQRWRA